MVLESLNIKTNYMSKGIVINDSKDVKVKDGVFIGLETAIEANNVSGLDLQNISVFDKSEFLLLQKQLTDEIDNSQLDVSTKKRLKITLDKTFKNNKVNQTEASTAKKMLKYVGDKAVDILIQMILMVSTQ